MKATRYKEIQQMANSLERGNDTYRYSPWIYVAALRELLAEVKVDPISISPPT